MTIGKKKKKKSKPASEEKDDDFDLSSLISALKDEPEADKHEKKEPEPEPKEDDEVFELVDDEPAKKASAEEEGRIKKIRAELEDEVSKFRSEKMAFEEERHAFEREKGGFTDLKKKTEGELKTFGADLIRKKEQISKLEEQLRNKENEQKEKEKNIKKATDLLISQRNSVGEKEKRLEALKQELQNKAQELKEKEEKLAAFKDKTMELDGREMRIKELEEKVKERELHQKSMEDQIADCPRCSSRDRFVNIERMIEELKDFEIVDAGAVDELKELRRLIDEGMNERAIEMGDKLIKRLKELKSEVLVKGIKYLLIGAEKALRHAKEVGGHGERVEDVERWLNEARGLIEKEEYKTAEYYIKEADFLLQSITKGVDTTQAPQEEAPVYEARSYNCPSCYTTFTVDTHERPVRITCPGCQIELLIKEDVSYA